MGSRASGSSPVAQPAPPLPGSYSPSSPSELQAQAASPYGPEMSPLQPPAMLGNGPGARSWVDLLRPKPSNQQQNDPYAAHLKKVQAQTTGKATFRKEEMEASCAGWKSALIGKFFGRPPPLPLLRREIPKLWHLQAGVKIIDLMDGFFIFRFDSEEDSIDVVTESPWTIQGSPITLFPWRPGFRALAEEVRTAPIWVQFPDLPMEYWGPELLPRIAGSLGRPLKVDQCTINQERGKFARVCIEMDITSPLPQGTWIESEQSRFFQPVEYDRLPSLCFSCGRVGHRADTCSYGKPKSPSSSVPPDSRQESPIQPCALWNRLKKKGHRSLAHG